MPQASKRVEKKNQQHVEENDEDLPVDPDDSILGNIDEKVTNKIMLNQDDIINLINNIDFDYEVATDEFKNSIEYQGFDAKRIAQKILKIAGSSATLKKDMTTLICLILYRGTRIEKIISKITNVEIKEAFNALRKRYDIVDTLPKNSNQDTITSSRLVATFPRIAESAARKGFCRSPVVIEGLMPGYRFFGAAAIINDISQLNLHLEWLIATSKIMMKDAEEVSVLKFAKIARKNSVIVGIDINIKTKYDAFNEG